MLMKWEKNLAKQIKHIHIKDILQIRLLDFMIDTMIIRKALKLVLINEKTIVGNLFFIIF